MFKTISSSHSRRALVAGFAMAGILALPVTALAYQVPGDTKDFSSLGNLSPSAGGPQSVNQNVIDVPAPATVQTYPAANSPVSANTRSMPSENRPYAQ